MQGKATALADRLRLAKKSTNQIKVISTSILPRVALEYGQT